MNNYKQPGNTVTLTAPSGGVTSGNAYKIGQLVVVATNTVAETLPFEGLVVGVVELTKTAGQAWTEGQLLYWDDTAKKVTSVATDNMLIGAAAAAAASADAAGLVRLNGVAQATGIPAGQIADGAVDTDALADDAVTAAKLAADAVDTAAIADGAVTAAKALAFSSTEQTGDGNPQNVAHGLGVTPTHVLIAVTEDPAGTGFDVAEGAHDTTNVVVTVTSGVKYKVFAWA